MFTIIDNSEVKFSLEKLSCCFLLDAYSILNCRKKASSKFEKIFFVSNDIFSVFKKSDFYIQNILLPDSCYVFKNDIFLVENIVSEFCSKISRINKNDWWIYAAKRQSNGFRIIAGIGKGIILSRFLLLDSDIANETSKTIVYLKRFGLKKNIKVFSQLRFDADRNISQIKCEEICIGNKHDNIEKSMSDFLLDNKVKPIIAHKKYFRNFLNVYIYALYVILLMSVCTLFIINGRIQSNEIILSSLKTDTFIEADGIKLKVNDENFFRIKQLVNTLIDCCNPINLLLRASELCRKHNFNISHLSISNGNQVVITTLLNKITFDKIKLDCKDIEIKKSSNEEYEDLTSNKQFEATICIK